MARDWARNGDNIVRVERSKPTNRPIHKPLGSVELTSQAGLNGICDDLLKIGIRNKGIIDQARTQWIGAGELKRCRCAVWLREIAAQCKVRRELVGPANHGIKMGIGG